MSFLNGDIISINDPVAGHRKYNISLGANEYLVNLCLYLNSKHSYSSDAPFPCARFTMLPASATGLTVVSLSMLPRYTAHQLNLYQATKLGVLPLAVAIDLLPLCAASRAFTKPERAFAVGRIDEYIQSLAVT